LNREKFSLPLFHVIFFSSSPTQTLIQSTDYRHLFLSSASHKHILLLSQSWKLEHNYARKLGKTWAIRNCRCQGLWRKIFPYSDPYLSRVLVYLFQSWWNCRHKYCNYVEKSPWITCHWLPTQRNTTFNPKRFHVGTEVEKVAADQISLQGLWFSTSVSFNQCFTLITFLSPKRYDFIKCQPRYVTLLYENIYLSIAY